MKTTVNARKMGTRPFKELPKFVDAKVTARLTKAAEKAKAPPA